METEQFTDVETASLRVVGQLLRTYHRLHRKMQSQMELDDLTLAQIEVLAILFRHPGITQQDLAERLVVTKGNVTGLIDRLARRGLVERRADPGDRRVHTLFLTEEGNAVWRRMLPRHARIAEDALTPLSADERQTMKTLLAKLEKAL